MSYRIELVPPARKKHQTTSLHLITGFSLLGIGAFTFLLGNTFWAKTIFHATVISSNILATISFFYGVLALYFVFFKGKWLKISKNNKTLRIAHVVDASFFAIIFLLSQWWLAASITGIVALANAFAIFYEQKLNEVLFIQFDKVGITLPHNSKRKQLKWEEAESIIFRQGNITINTTDNYLYQWTTKKNDINFEEFEDYCAANILSNSNKREINDW
jgi:hypothetical protein